MSRLRDITGFKYGMLTVIERAQNDDKGRAQWMCKCECGKNKIVASYSLTSGNTKSCGCIATGGHNKIDMAGMRFGRLVVVEPDQVRKGQTFWKCKCDCGIEKSICASKLRTEQTRSCGCLRREVSANRETTHGHAANKRSATYNSWRAMKQRCLNPRYFEYHFYGGRGISVCSEWMNYEAFLRDMGERPNGCTLDRVDVNGNYCKSNCRWATAIEQQNNKRRNH